MLFSMLPLSQIATLHFNRNMALPCANHGAQGCLSYRSKQMERNQWILKARVIMQVPPGNSTLLPKDRDKDNKAEKRDKESILSGRLLGSDNLR